MKLLPDGETINELLTSNVNYSELSKLDSKTLLLMLSWLGETELVKILLENGADVSAEDEEGR